MTHNTRKPELPFLTATYRHNKINQNKPIYKCSWLDPMQIKKCDPDEHNDQVFDHGFTKISPASIHVSPQNILN